MKQQLEQVREFRRAFRLPVDVEVNFLKAHDARLHVKLITEELEELEDALLDNDKVETLDAIADIMYLCFGIIENLGYSKYLEKVFEEVHRSNMSKLDEFGNPIFREDGKVEKSYKYLKPNIRRVIDLIDFPKYMKLSDATTLNQNEINTTYGQEKGCPFDENL